MAQHYDRSNDPTTDKLGGSSEWGTFYGIKKNPRAIGKGDCVSFGRDYSIDMSFGSKGTSLSDISEQYALSFGYPHQEMFEAAIDNDIHKLKHLHTEKNHLLNEQLKIGDQWTPLHGAVCYNLPNVVELLLKFGADYNIKDMKNRSPLTLACIIRAKECETILRKYVKDDKEHLEELSQEKKKFQDDYDMCANYISQ